jgi:DNA (cytosine-5)-methyltransferase 1
MREFLPNLESNGGVQPNGGGQVAIVFTGAALVSKDITHTLRADGGTNGMIGTIVASGANTSRVARNQESYTVVDEMIPRRLSPTECEKLQGFSGNYTLIPWRKGLAPDSLRYRACGNSKTTNVVKWIGERIMAVENERN